MKRKILIYLIVFSFFISLAGSQNAKTNQAENTIEKGEVVMRSTDGYNWWSYVPESLQKNDPSYILLEESYLGAENYEKSTNNAKNHVLGWKSISEEKKLIIVTVVMPRHFDNRYYPQGINLNSLDPSTPEFYYRPDLKVNNIISGFINNLTKDGYSIYNKTLVAGFSAGGMWANRYTLLHPERVKAAAIGQAGGWLAMPFTEYNGTSLNWPMGINNFANLTGDEYKKQDLLKEVPQFIFIGDQDDYSTYVFDPWPTEDLIQIWGTTDPERLKNQSKWLENANYSVEFKLYQGVGHSYNSEMKNDLLAFFDTVIVIQETSNTIPNYPFLVLMPMIIITMIALALFYQKRSYCRFYRK